MKLSSENVERIFRDCLFKEDEDKSNAFIVEGVLHKTEFHPERLESHEKEISEMLDELSDTFRPTGGGGHSFLSLCEDKHGNQWTGLHLIMDYLVMLGVAIKKVEFLAPRELWSILPGGMPYIVVK